MYMQKNLRRYLKNFSNYLIFQARECSDLSLKEELLALASRQKRMIELIEESEKTRLRIQHLSNEVVNDAYIGEYE